jgi:hypothetical protein
MTAVSFFIRLTTEDGPHHANMSTNKTVTATTETLP